MEGPLEAADRYRRKGMKIGEGTKLYAVEFGRGGDDPVEIGANCVLTGCLILGHDASTNYHLGIEKSICVPTIVEDDCFVGRGAIILMGVRVGKGSIVGAGAIVTRDVPEGSIVGGNPAKVIGKVADLVEKRLLLAKEHPEYFRDLPKHI